MERVTRKTLQRGSTVEDLRAFLEAAGQEADLPTAGTERERLGGELVHSRGSYRLLSGASAARLSDATSARMEDLGGHVAGCWCVGGRSCLRRAETRPRPQRTGRQRVPDVAHATETGRCT